MTPSSAVTQVAITGTGYAARMHASALLEIQGTQLVAVVNHRAESRRVFADDFGVGAQYSTVEELFADQQPHALVVATPNFLHSRQTIAALQAGAHVLVEKPLTRTAAEAEEIDRCESEAYVMVGQLWRFDPDVRWLRQRVLQGDLGDLIRTRCIAAHVGWAPQTSWFMDPELAGGGALIDMGVHAIDTTRFMLGDPQPEVIEAATGTYYSPSPVDDTAVVWTRWDNGVTSIIETGWAQPHADGPTCTIQVYGSKGYGQTFPTFTDPVDSAPRQDPSVDIIGRPGSQQTRYEAQMRHFIECIRRGVPPQPDTRVGLTDMKVIDAAYQSSAMGRPVVLTPSGVGA